MTVGVAEVHQQRSTVILVVELDAMRAETLLGGVEMVDDDCDVPEPRRLGLTGRRLSLRLEQSEFQPRLTKKDGLVVLRRLIQLRQPKHVPIHAIDRARSVTLSDT